MTSISLTDARRRLPEIINDVSDHLVEYTITRRGRAEAVVLSVEEHDALLETLDILTDSAALEGVRRGLDELAKGETVGFEEVFGEQL